MSFYQKIAKCSIVLFLFVQLSACNTVAPNADYIVKEDIVVSKEKAIVITRMYHHEEGLFVDENVPVQYALAKVDTDYPDRKTRHSYARVTDPDAYSVSMIEPGVYVLEDLFLKAADGVHYSAVQGVHRSTEKFLYGGFVVHPGEVMYIGDIHCSENLKLEVKDRYQAAVEFFAAKYPEVAAQKTVKKNLLNTKGSLNDYKKEFLHFVKEKLS